MKDTVFFLKRKWKKLSSERRRSFCSDPMQRVYWKVIFGLCPSDRMPFEPEILNPSRLPVKSFTDFFYLSQVDIKHIWLLETIFVFDSEAWIVALWLLTSEHFWYAPTSPKNRTFLHDPTFRFNPTGMRRNNNVIMTSKRRRFDAVMVLRRVYTGKNRTACQRQWTCSLVNLLNSVCVHDVYTIIMMYAPHDACITWWHASRVATYG